MTPVLKLIISNSCWKPVCWLLHERYVSSCCPCLTWRSFTCYLSGKTWFKSARLKFSMWASWVRQPPHQAIQEDRGLPVWLCSLGSCTRRPSACVKNTPATCTWPVFVCISECSHSVPPPSILVRDIFPTGESLKGWNGNKTPSISPACVNTACPYMTCTWGKSPKGRICQIFTNRMRMDVG